MRLATVVLLAAGLCTAASAANAPKLAGPFQMSQLRGANITFAQYRGKVLVVTFILTTCPHCQALTNVLSPLAREFAPRGVQFLECAFNDDARATMSEFLDRFHPPFPVGWTNQAVVRSYLHYSILDPHLYVPHMIFIDRAGRLRDDFPAEADFFKNPETSIRAELDKLLKK